MESAIFGLIGVALGALLGGVKEWYFNHQKAQKDAVYLVIQVSCSLDRYVSKCSSVVYDDGYCDGQHDERGCLSPQVQLPEFSPLSLNVEWRSLPANLMFEVLDFPRAQELAVEKINVEWEYGEGPPDYSDFFEERQLQFATLGIQAAHLEAKLRQYVNLEGRPYNGWSTVRHLERKKKEIEARREKRAAHAGSAEKLSANGAE